MILVEPAVEDHIDRILEIENEAFAPPWTHGTLLSELYRKDSFFAAAVENDRILGFVILRRMQDEGELLQIAVDQTERQRGIAGLLMTAALNDAIKNAVRTVFLEVRKSNNAAISLYGKHGFVFVRRRKDYYCNPMEDALIMQRRL